MLGKTLTPRLRAAVPRLRALAAHLRGMRMAAKDDRRYCVAAVLEHHARSMPYAVAVKTHERRWTWAEYNREANRVAAHFLGSGYRPGDVVALVMENSPRYLFLLAGLNKIGVVPALVNPGLSGEPLAHTLRQCRPGCVIADAEFMAAVGAALAATGLEASLYSSKDDAADATCIAAQLPAQAENPPQTRDRRAGDLMMYLFTSGTTGLPKAAIITNRRFLTIAHGVGGPMTQFGSDDTLYLTLPLYHATGAMAGFGMALLGGGAIVLRRRFSASEFWDDCVRFDATVFNYIGEICRYLVMSPPHPLERSHLLRVAVGAGMRPDVWEPFQQRFAIGRIAEGYSATEGNIALFNVEGRPGMLGRLLPGQAIVHIDPDTEEFIRDRRGRLQRVRAGEQGMLIGRIGRVTPFDGYLEKKRGEEKIVRNAFGDGRDWFNSGDLVQLHPWRWVSFADRLGDTYRWKGENISTVEVGNLLTACVGICEANVYGVAVPGHEGRAGMAAVVVSDDFDFDGFSASLCERVPPALRPKFLRIVPALQKTASFKYIKVPLQREGFDPSLTDDPLYVHDGNTWLPIDDDSHQRVIAGDIRL